MKGVQNYYSDLSSLGKYYNVVDYGSNDSPVRKGGRVLRRQYAIANCLNKTFYQEIIKAIKSVGNVDYVFNQQMLSCKHNNEVNLAVKNYNLKNGMSANFFDPNKKNHNF